MDREQEVKVQDYCIFVFSAPRDWTTVTCSATCVSSHDCRTSSWTRTGMTPSPNCSSAVSQSAPWRAESQIFPFTSMYERDAASMTKLALDKSLSRTGRILVLLSSFYLEYVATWWPYEMYMLFTLLWYCDGMQVFLCWVLKITNMVMDQDVHIIS